MTNSLKAIQITECPRDAMQGIQNWIPTEQKVRYLNALLKCGFGVLDFGSFVSPKAIPQLKDSASVLAQLEPSPTQLLAIIANLRGAEEACSHERIAIIGYPFSVSETFQLRNTNSITAQAINDLQQISNLCKEHGKKLRVYLSMGFGNPYGDPWSVDLVAAWVAQLSSRFDIAEYALSDTIACASAELAEQLFQRLSFQFPHLLFAAHLHVVKGREEALIKACIAGGCQHFDTAIGGFGGCPMAKDELTGNLSTEALLAYAKKELIKHTIDDAAFETARQISTSIF
jgi:hydroxymethylglutaryl-CoA lyase